MPSTTHRSSYNQARLPVWDLGKATVLSHRSIRRPEGYSLGGLSIGIAVQLAGQEADGYGEGEAPFHKAYSEAIERCAFRAYRAAGFHSNSSNGWAAHLTMEAALEAALLELIERHTVLTCWESFFPFYEVPISLWPAALLRWSREEGIKAEFGKAHVFMSTAGMGAAVSVLLFNARGGLVAGHASSLDLQSATLSAAREAMRAAHAALRFESFSDVRKLHSPGFRGEVDPGAHSLAYAYGASVPSEVEFRPSCERAITKIWYRHLAQYREIRNSLSDWTVFKAEDRFVIRAAHPSLRPIYWGRLPNAITKNKAPHFVG